MTSPATCCNCGYQVGLWLNKEETFLRSSLPIVCSDGRMHIVCSRCSIGLTGGDIMGSKRDDARQRTA